MYANGAIPQVSRPPDCPENIFAIMKLCYEAFPKDRPTFVQLAEKFKDL